MSSIAKPKVKESKDLAPQRKLTKLQLVVETYKWIAGIGYRDVGGKKVADPEAHKKWDKANFGAYARSAAKLLAAFDGDVDKARVWMMNLGQEWQDKGLTWGLAGIARHAQDFVAKGGNDADRGREGGVGGELAGRQGPGALAHHPGDQARS